MIYKVWDGNTPQNVHKIPNEVASFVDNGTGYYNKTITKQHEDKFIAVFGANSTHLTRCATGIHKGDGQAYGVTNCKNVMPLDTMSADSAADYRNKLLATIRYQFSEMGKRKNTPFVIPCKLLTEDDIKKLKSTSNALYYEANTRKYFTAIINPNCKNKDSVKEWLNNLKVGDAIVNMGFGICTKPDIEVLYEINTLAEKAIASQKAKPANMIATNEEIKSWKEEVLPNVADITRGKISPDSVAEDGKILPQKGSGNTVAKDDVTKFKTVLQKIRTQNKDLAKLSVDKVLEIFHDASENKYYTNRKPQLPLDVSGNSRTDKDAVLMRKFSVEFQRECNTQGLNFSDRGQNENGMRTKSVMGFLKKNNGGDIQKLLKAEWERK